MTSFGTLFSEFFKEKSKTTYAVYFVQLGAALISVIIGSIAGHSFDVNDALMAGVPVNGLVVFIISLCASFLSFSVFAEPIYLIMTSRRNEKINRSQTWRLVPTSDTKFYLSNTLSSYASYLYLAILQLVTALLGFILTYAFSANVRKAFAKMMRQGTRYTTGLDWKEFWLIMAEFLALIILIGLLWYLIVSLYNFASRAIIDFLPASNHFVLFLVKAVVWIVITVLLYQIIARTVGLFNVFFGYANLSDIQGMGVAILELFIFNLLFAGLNLWLINHFVEAKQN